ncbi:MAG TPA: polymer-forming cytoskeletal protein [Spirochaetota bacterium]|nr:polymer-forming cytoskeletal protein [Spirochaetota bacterium]
MALRDSLNSTIGEGSSFEGKFYISGSLRIDGKFEGEIKTDDELVVGESGKVKTNIEARSVVVAGTVVGNITAREEVKLLETAKVLGDVIAPAIQIQRGVIMQGNIKITGSAKKEPRSAVEESYNANSLVRADKSSGK